MTFHDRRASEIEDSLEDARAALAALLTNDDLPESTPLTMTKPGNYDCDFCDAGHSKDIGGSYDSKSCRLRFYTDLQSKLRVIAERDQAQVEDLLRLCKTRIECASYTGD